MQRCRRALVPTALIGLALGSAQVGLARGDEAFGRFVDAYFAARFADRPSEGTAAGLHEYDTRLEDPSRPHVEQRIVELKDQLGRLQAFDRAMLAFDEAIDAEVLDGQIRAELLDLETLRVWERNPMLYAGLPGLAVDRLMKRRFAPRPSGSGRSSPASGPSPRSMPPRGPT